MNPPPGAPKPPPRPPAPTEPPPSNGGYQPMEVMPSSEPKNPLTDAVSAPSGAAGSFGWNAAAAQAAPPPVQQPPMQQHLATTFPPQQPTAPASHQWGQRPDPRSLTTEQQHTGIVQSAGSAAQQQPTTAAVAVQPPTTTGGFQQSAAGLLVPMQRANGGMQQPTFVGAPPTAAPPASLSSPAPPTSQKPPMNEPSSSSSSRPASMVVESSSGPSAPMTMAGPSPATAPTPNTLPTEQQQQQQQRQAYGGGAPTHHQPSSFTTAAGGAPPVAPPPGAAAPMATTTTAPPPPVSSSSGYPAAQKQQHYVSAAPPATAAAPVPPTAVASLPQPPAGEHTTGGANHNAHPVAREQQDQGIGANMDAGAQHTAAMDAGNNTGWAQQQNAPAAATQEPSSASSPDGKPFATTRTAPPPPAGQLKSSAPEMQQSHPMEAVVAAAAAARSPSYDDGSNHNVIAPQQTQQQSSSSMQMSPPQSSMQTDVTTRPSYDQHHNMGSSESGGGGGFQHNNNNMHGGGQPPPPQQQSAIQHDTHLVGHQQARGPPPQQPPPQHHGHHGPPPEQQHPQQHGAAPYGNEMMGHAPPPPQQQPPPPPPPGGMRELRVEDALLYLDDVKREFKDRPAIYNEFLAIMKNFKSQEVDTPGVIARVSKLFRGYNNLILGFNTFLPDGYKISLADLERAEAQRMAEEQAARESQEQQGKKPKGPAKRAAKDTGPDSSFQQRPLQGKAMSPQAGPGSMQPGQWSQGQSSHGMPPPNQQGISPQKQLGQPRSPFGPNQGVQQQVGPPQHQAVEFDHAISYVTTIKRRFANDPNTYHSFLEILHTYQKEQRGIKEVLEQVAHLFQDHPDLLKEFTFFLPDAVQEQAKERLHRAAAESESRIAAQRQQQMEQYHQRMGKGSAQQGGQHFIDMTRSQMGLGDTDARGRKRLADGQQLPAQQPEAYVYNSAVERQFFDSVREALTSYSRDGGQAWAEFLKCVDMYAQEILSRGEMLNFVEPLLGKRNNNLFEEFKRMLIAAGSPTHSTQLVEDSWYSVPLSEIDFSRCRRCSPSYRALPRDYPAHPCSDRSEEEAAVLNDIWVSLPVGSEESYTFRHMRRNTYEETLFRVEDERFEIDMVIDSNGATLQRLEPIAEEIALLAQEDVLPLADLGIKPQVEGAGLGGKRFQYTFDKNILGVIHRNSIARIYGDAGQEMLDLLVKNPTVAVPLVVQRLRQKDTEWRKVRDRLNLQWKELSEHNYYKSLDNRSLTWRTTDKRAISTRTLIAEIKDRALNEGREGKEAMRQKLDKAKEEHGSFYEVTVGQKLTQTLDLTFLPKPDRRLFTPHLSLMYKNVSWAQRDAYRILAFALERGPISPSDKERCHRLWVEFLGPWFDLSLNWMQKPAVCYQESTSAKPGAVRAAEASVVSEEDEDSIDEDPELMGNVVTEELRETDSKDKEFTDHHPLPAGAHVSTLYGEGKILEFRRDDHIYAVQLAFGATGYLRPATVLCSMLPVEKSAYTRQLRADDRSKLARPNDRLAFGTQSLYLFFRLHHILVNRLNTAKRLAYSVGDDKTLQSMVEQMPNVNPKAVGRRRYEAYLSLVYALLDGGVGGAAEGGKYEDRVRSLLGHGAYELATMDKLISHIWKDIQTMANDETMWNLVQLYRRHLLAGSFQPEAFRQEAAYLSDGEPMYAFQYCPLSRSDESVLHMEYLGIMDDEDEDAIEEELIEPVEQPNSNKRPKR